MSTMSRWTWWHFGISLVTSVLRWQSRSKTLCESLNDQSWRTAADSGHERHDMAYISGSVGRIGSGWAYAILPFSSNGWRLQLRHACAMHAPSRPMSMGDIRLRSQELKQIKTEVWLHSKLCRAREWWGSVTSENQIKSLKSTHLSAGILRCPIFFETRKSCEPIALIRVLFTRCICAWLAPLS